MPPGEQLSQGSLPQRKAVWSCRMTANARLQGEEPMIILRNKEISFAVTGGARWGKPSTRAKKVRRLGTL